MTDAQGQTLRVSVIIPMYNEEAYIGACLESLCRQTFPLEQMEILVVDGASRDGSAAAVESMMPRLPNLRLLRNTVRWTPSSLNMAIRQARAPVVLRLDCHCRYKEDYVERCLAALERTGAGCVGGRLLAHAGGGGLMAESIRVAQESRFGTGGSRWRSGGEAGHVDTVPFGCFPRAVFDEVGLYDERLRRNQDFELAGRIRAFGHRIYFDPAIEASYYTRATLGGYVRMMWVNAVYLPMMWRINRSSFQLRHVIPMLFFLGVAAGLVSLLVFPPLAWAAAAGLALYLLIDLAFSCRIAAGEGPRLLLTMPWLFLLTHLLYGLGTLVGLARYGLARLPENPDVKHPPSGGKAAVS